MLQSGRRVSPGLMMARVREVRHAPHGMDVLGSTLHEEVALVLGNEHDADTAAWAAGVVNGWEGYTEPGQQFENGWKYLGRGMHRYAFLSPEQVVYKVERGNDTVQRWRDMEEDWMDEGVATFNEAEHLASASIHAVKHLPAVAEHLNLVYVPLTEMHGEVLAMEFIKGGDESQGYRAARKLAEEHGEDYEQAARKLGIRDTHDANIRFMDDGRVALIDLGLSQPSSLSRLTGEVSA